jgi:hypothetical protein
MLGFIGVLISAVFKNEGSKGTFYRLFFWLVDDLGLVGGPLVVGRKGLLVEGFHSFLRVSALLRCLSSGNENSLRNETDYYLAINHCHFSNHGLLKTDPNIVG